MPQRPILVAACSVLAVSILPVIWLAVTLRQPVHPIDDLVAIQTVDEAITRMKTAALNAEAVDWGGARSSALEIFGRTRTRESLELGNGGAIGISTTRLMTANGAPVSGPLRPEIEVDSSSFGDSTLRAAQDWSPATSIGMTVGADRILSHF